jgi:hydrogenase nickel incorporation protein HypB
LPVLGDFSPAKAEEHVRALANAADVMTVSARQTESLTPWLDWLVATRRAVALERPAAAGSHHRHHEHATP